MFLVLLVANIVYLHAENDTNFVINFKTATTKNLPVLGSVTFPETSRLSVCLWYKVNEIPYAQFEKCIFYYSPRDLKFENFFAIWVSGGKMESYIRGILYDFTGPLKIYLSKWVHVCWIWEVTGGVAFYYNGRLHRVSQNNVPKYKLPFPKGSGTLTLGQDRDSDLINDASQMFRGRITGLYIYNSTLNEDDVRDIFYNKPTQKNIIVGWWQFKNKTNGHDIVEEPGRWCLNDQQCQLNAKCVLEVRSRVCVCNHGFIESNINSCRDVRFVINFKRWNITNLPILPIMLPKINQLSVCSWFQLRTFPNTRPKALFSYHQFMMEFYQNYIHLVLGGYGENVSGRISFILHQWNHICWTWNNQGKSMFYYNGTVYKENRLGFRNSLPSSYGRLILGQNVTDDPENMFEGRIRGFFIYSRKLEAYEVSRMFYGQSIREDVIVEWQEFYGTTSGDAIVEESGSEDQNFRCRNGWIRFKSNCYLFSTFWMSWLEAESRCNRFDAHLTSVLDDEENTFIKNNVPSDYCWLGLYGSVKENIFQWTDKTPYNYSNWKRNDQNKKEKCVIMKEGFWENVACETSVGYHICKEYLATNVENITDISGDELVTINRTCPVGWIRYNDSCYLFSDLFGTTLHDRKWIDAKYYCNYIGGDLISILDEDENNFISEYLTVQKTGYWIGLHDNIIEGKYVWTDRSNYTFQRWKYGNPNVGNSKKNCVVFYIDGWSDIPCTNKLPFICKQNLENITYVESKLDVWFIFGGNEYLFSNIKNSLKTLSWNAAKIYCQDSSGSLASIESQSENEFIKRVYWESFGNSVTDYWIGLNDINEENVFIWTDGFTGNYTPWDKNQPSDTENNEDCVAFSTTGQWKDVPCSLNNNFICKSKSFERDAKENSDNLLAILLPISVIFIIILCLAAVLYRKFIIKKQKKLAYQPSTMLSFQSRSYFEPKKATDGWEIKQSSLKIIKEIGTGSFGKVYCGVVENSAFKKSFYMKHAHDKPLDTKFAVKYLKDFANVDELHSFQAEIELMKRIGHHQNIINLVGCCTEKSPMCLILEYMSHGDLLGYLRRCRTGALHIDVSDKYAVTGSKVEVSSQDLLSFSWQIACGMEFLSGQKFVHRDLAARNVLVGSDKTVKVADFGLSRFLDNDMVYTTQTSRRLPIKWMAIECIYNNEFTVSSDVWSYGIVLFEIFTIGGTPYPGIGNSELIQRLKTGYRLEKADNISDELYEIMKSCWHGDPKQRPTFEGLRLLFEKMISENAEYLTLNVEENADYYWDPSFLTFEEEEDDKLDSCVIENQVDQNDIKQIQEPNY